MYVCIMSVQCAVQTIHRGVGERRRMQDARQDKTPKSPRCRMHDARHDIVRGCGCGVEVGVDLDLDLGVDCPTYQTLLYCVSIEVGGRYAGSQSGRMVLG
jgi:hypothetical protein